MIVVKSLFLLAVCMSALAHRVPSKDLQTPEYVLSAKLQLPKEEDPPVFDSYLPIPNEGEDGDELAPPNAEAWNPNKDPNLYYGTEENTATNVYPKKYNKDVVEKIKPLLAKPKDEEILSKQKDISLTLTPPSETAWNPNNDPIYYYDTEKPSANILSEILYNPKSEDKKNYNYEKAQNQRLVKEA
ncbi:PREDICTED: uncharacterized protein LOC108560275 [Nicrophorus vespilloides]|uniref:Uncharacterized protein LOC108560275 n=1 Tax=Nicrophorus vespilloides TaxID=110193 RepID=A0ABM1MF88_NICVS|nr:PREDICTED: uncharacterized protein LOC108560275 [Nicrophorus vespilloides]